MKEGMSQMPTAEQKKEGRHARESLDNTLFPALVEAVREGTIDMTVAGNVPLDSLVILASLGLAYLEEEKNHDDEA